MNRVCGMFLCVSLQPNLMYHSEPGHKDGSLHDQQEGSKVNKVNIFANALIFCFSVVQRTLYEILYGLFNLILQGSKLNVLHEEEKQGDAYTLLQYFTPPMPSAVQALKFCGLDKLISTSYDDSYVCQLIASKLQIHVNKSHFFRSVSGIYPASSQYRV